MTTMRKLVKGSLRLINAISANEEPSADDTDITLKALNGMIDSMANDILNIYTFNPYRFLLVPGQETYKLGPAVDSGGNATGADWVIERPMRIEQAKMMLYPSVSCTAGCNLVSSNLDGETIDLWHFDEAAGATEVTPTVSFNNGPQGVDGTFDFVSGACANGMVGNIAGGSNGILLGQGGNGEFTASTIEFALYNEGILNPVPLDFIEIFRTDGVNYAFGEGQTIMRGFKLGQDLVFVKNSDIFSPPYLFTVPLPVNEWVSVALQYDFAALTVGIYINGVRVHVIDIEDEWGTYNESNLVASFTYFNAGDVRIDEFRRSNTARYGATYNYLQAGGGSGGNCEIGCTPSTLFLPIRKLTMMEYSGLRLRCLPNQWPTGFYDSGSFPTRSLSFWPVPTQQNAVELWLWEPLTVYSDLDQELNLPPGYERYLRFKLAAEISPEFGKELPPSLVKSMEEAETNVKKLNQTHPKAFASQSGAALLPNNRGYASIDSYPVGSIPRSW